MKEYMIWDLLEKQIIDAIFINKGFTFFEPEVRLLVALIVSVGRDRKYDREQGLEFDFFNNFAYNYFCEVLNLSADKISSRIKSISKAIDNNEIEDLKEKLFLRSN